MSNRKSIFITGAASGIGRETALLFASKSWYVGIVDMNEEITEVIAQKFEELGISRVRIRSLLTCESKKGVCANYLSLCPS